MRLLTGILAVIALIGAAFPPALYADGLSVATGAANRKSARRLPPGITPVSYDLLLKPDLLEGTFEGSEDINIKVAEPSSCIYLNSKDLTVTGGALRLTGSADKNGLAVKPEVLASDEMIALQTGSSIEPGDYILHIDYKAKLSDKLTGFYKSTFKDKTGKSHPLAATQFEPTEARRMLPCFDEPQMKARFKISVDINKDYVAISNAPSEKELVTDSGRRIVQFAETPPMSSYLLALVIGEFEPTQSVVAQGIAIRVWSVAGKSSLGLYSRDVAAKILPALTGYFGISYPWTKLDLVAIPDFEAGAMENPGCITFRETLLLLDSKKASSGAQRSCAGVIAHEMAHLWFGDLVTMRWWDDLWLNEAFATFMATRTINTVFPQWDAWKDYIEDRVAALRTDALHATRSIHAPVGSPDEALEMFDVITYEKGASVLRMLERYVGEKKFQKGIHEYLKEHSFGNATTADLWESIAIASGAPVKKVMSGWVNQPGYPILTVNAAASNRGRLTFKQKRFFLTGEESSDCAKWDVPVGIRTLGKLPKSGQNDASETLLLKSSTMTFEHVAPARQVYFANAGGVGYYRVRYPRSLTQRIEAAMQSQLDPGERLCFLDDEWNLALAGQVPITEYLELLDNFRNEPDDIVWEKIVSSLGSLSYFVDDSKRPAFQTFIRQTLASIQQKLGWQPKSADSQRRRMLRGRIIETLGTIGQDAVVIKKARESFENYRLNNGSLDRDLVDPVFQIVAYNGSAHEYNLIKQLYRTAKTPEEEHRSLFTLAAFSNKELAAKTMELSIDSSVRIQDGPHLLGSLLSRRQTGAAAWAFLKANWQKIMSRYSPPMIPDVVAHASSFNTVEMYNQVQAFVKAHPLPAGESTAKRMLENIKINVAFRQRSARSLNEWLSHHAQ